MTGGHTHLLGSQTLIELQLGFFRLLEGLEEQLARYQQKPKSSLPSSHCKCSYHVIHEYSIVRARSLNMHVTFDLGNRETKPQQARKQLYRLSKDVEKGVSLNFG